jgi:hypothetical protein
MVHKPMGFVQKFLLLVTYFFEMRPLKMDEFHRLTVPELEKRVGETKSVDKPTEW